MSSRAIVAGVLLASSTAAQAESASLSAATGIIAGGPGGGAALHASLGEATGVSLKLNGGAYVHTRFYGPYAPPVAMGSAEIAYHIAAGNRWGLGPMVAGDGLFGGSAEEYYKGGIGVVRYWRWVDMGPVGAQGEWAAGLSAQREGDKARLELDFGLGPLQRYDMAMLNPHLGIAWSNQRYRIGVETSGFHAAATVGLML